MKKIDKKVMPALLSKFIEEGERLIKPRLKKEWMKIIKEYLSCENIRPYLISIIKGALKIMKALSRGRSPREAKQTANRMKLDKFQEMCIATMVKHFHPQGEEFWKWYKEND